MRELEVNIRELWENMMGDNMTHEGVEGAERKNEGAGGSDRHCLMDPGEFSPDWTRLPRSSW